MLISLTMFVCGTSLQAQSPFAIVRGRVHPSQIEKFDRLPIEELFVKAGFSSRQTMPKLFESLRNGEGQVSVSQGLTGRLPDRLISVSIRDKGGSSSLLIVFDSVSGRPSTWQFEKDVADPWKVDGWQGTESNIRRIADAFVTSNFPGEADLEFLTMIPKDRQFSENITKRSWFIPYQWILDGRYVGGSQAASVVVDGDSGAILGYSATLGAVQRRSLWPGEVGQSRAHLAQRLVTRYGNGFYGLGQGNLIYSPREGDRWTLIAKWELQCTEYDHLGRRKAFIQIIMDPESKAVLHEDRSVGGFGPSSPVPGSQIAGEWQAGEIKGQIRTTDRKATQGGVQRTLTSGNRLLVGTFFAAERLLEVKGVFFEVDPALSEALAKAQPPASLNYGQ